MSWTTLGGRARAWRVVHAAWSVAGLASLGYIWACAATGRRDKALVASVGFLCIEGAGLTVGGGDCPMGALQAEWGDPKPFFELVLPPRAAKAAVPVLAMATVAGLVALVLRRPSRKGPAVAAQPQAVTAAKAISGQHERAGRSPPIPPAIGLRER